jgi:hypothetical protein
MPIIDPVNVHRCPFAISIYEGDCLQQMRPLEGSSTPAITKEAVLDFTANFVADPFLARDREQWVLFFETKPFNSKQGQIAFASSRDLRTWTYGGLVEGLGEGQSHISYPHVFCWDGQWWMTPETEKRGMISLFRAVEFPRRWELQANLVTGSYCDPTPFEHAGRWYLFASNRYTLRLWHAGSPLGYWREHPASPLRVRDLHAARPAGRVIHELGYPLRLAQDCGGSYGWQVVHFEITRLTSTQYEERSLGRIVGPGDPDSWNQHGTHHIDAQRWQGRWIAAVDGR